MLPQSLRPLCYLCLCGVLVLTQGGCATHPPTIPPEVLAQFGSIGLVSAQYSPALEYELPAKGWLGGLGRGAVRGAGTFVVLVPTATLMGIGSGAPAAGAGAIVGAFLGAATGAIVGAGYMIGGPFYGAFTAESTVDVEAAEKKLKEILNILKIQETMRAHLVDAARSQAGKNIALLEGEGPRSDADLLNYWPEKNFDQRTIFELRVLRLRLSSKAQVEEFNPLKINPLLSFGMEVRLRIIHSADREVLFDDTWTWTGIARTFTEWAANNGQPFMEELEQVYDNLAKQIVSDLFQVPLESGWRK